MKPEKAKVKTILCRDIIERGKKKAIEIEVIAQNGYTHIFEMPIGLSQADFAEELRAIADSMLENIKTQK